MIPLSMVEAGKRVRIRRVIGGNGVIKKLREMGLLDGEELCILTNADGPVVVTKDSLKFALGKGISHKILVEEVF